MEASLIDLVPHNLERIQIPKIAYAGPRSEPRTIDYRDKKKLRNNVSRARRQQCDILLSIFQLQLFHY